MTDTQTVTERRTKRRYAHEIYPHPAEGEVRPLEIEVPYLYARMVGLGVDGTSWYDAPWRENQWARELTHDRTVLLLEARSKALLADALLQGLTGDEAWSWAERRTWDESGEIARERAQHYGIPFDDIKPYPCGPEPDHHDHLSPSPYSPKWQMVTRVPGKESECDDCTEPVEAQR